MSDNVLYYGDNLDVMRQHLKDETEFSSRQQGNPLAIYSSQFP